MVAIADSISKSHSRFRFILDRRDVLGSLMVAPAILYVLLLVGVPFLMAVYYSLSAYTIYDPSWAFVGLDNFADIIDDPSFRQTLYNTFVFTFGSQLLGRFNRHDLSMAPRPDQIQSGVDRRPM